jgi:hypothetical protein
MSDCPSGKHVYPNKTAAKRAGKALTRKRGGRIAREYTCPECAEWHLTSYEYGQTMPSRKY